jgi:hypothetical protein
MAEGVLAEVKSPAPRNPGGHWVEVERGNFDIKQIDPDEASRFDEGSPLRPSHTKKAPGSHLYPMATRIARQED